MTKDEIDEYFRVNTHTLSTDFRMGDMDDSLSDVLHDKTDVSAEDQLMHKTVETQLNTALAHLTEREAEIICSYFGLNGKIPMTLEEIGERFDLTRERVRQIKEKCIRQLKESTSPHLLQAYIQ